MPRLRLNLSTRHGRWTKVPNILLDRMMPELSDTELRVLLAVIRRTTGWGREGRAVVLRYREMKAITGRHSEAISRAVKGLSESGYVTRVGTHPAHRKPKRIASTSEGQQGKTVLKKEHAEGQSLPR